MKDRRIANRRYPTERWSR